MLNPVLFAAQSLLHEGQRAMTTERVVNMFPELIPRGRQPVTLRSVPGMLNKVNLGTGRVWGALPIVTGKQYRIQHQ